MRLRLPHLIALVLAVSVAACSGSAPSQAFGKEDAQQINKLVQDFIAAYNAKDVEKIGSLFSASATIMPANRSTLSGIESVKGFFRERLNVEGATDLKIETLTVEGHGPLAYFAGAHSLNLKPAAGEARHDRGKVIWILKKLGGQWRFDRQMMSSDLPPVVPAPSEPVK
jgi:ketosteroid isomerase-like protein